MTEYDGPKTVTFNQTPQDEAQFRSARLGRLAIGSTIGLASIGLTLVAGLWALQFAASLAATWGEVFKLSVVAVATVLCVSGLPIASALLSRSYADLADQAMAIWAAALGFTAISVIIATWTMQDLALDAPTDGWAPRDLLPMTLNLGNGALRELSIAAFGLLCFGGSGLLGRLAVLAMAETYRLGYSEASAGPSGASAAAQPVHGAGALTPADVFSMWANSRLVNAAGGSVQGSAAFDDYADTCRLNFVEPMSSTKFGIMMTSRAEASQGRVIKEKSGGLIMYRGWKLATDLQAVGGSQPVAQITHRRT